MYCISFSRFMDFLPKQIIKFKLEKRDGSNRIAYGTINTDIINSTLSGRPEESKTMSTFHRIRETGKGRNPNTVVFFDFAALDRNGNRGAFRTMRVTDGVFVDEDYKD